MSVTRDNHYVPQWYQRGFFDTNRKTLKYVDMRPDTNTLPDGRIIRARDKFDSPTSRCFYKTDLYSTFFGTAVDDEIERRLFGKIDDMGSEAIRAFIGDDVGQWHKHFQDFFAYIDAQKIRTPKGLDWLKEHYPLLHQNELMREMQGVQRMHCTIWTEGVREIVSAQDSDVKFLVSDHPVTVYNYALPPDHNSSAYPNDPSIALKASQTLYPLNKDFCLILTNLEYAKNPDLNDPCEKRTFAKNYRNSMVRTDAFIRSRKLTGLDVSRINYVLKTRACRYIAAGREEWLYPEKVIDTGWADLRKTILPPHDDLWHFGGEMIAKFDDGSVYYQDEFGRTEKQRDFLQKTVSEKTFRPNDACGCGSGKKYKKCCVKKPVNLRPSWSELSIRERNIIHYRAIVDILGIDDGKTWTDVRRELTDEKIKKIYSVFEGLWPLETDLVDLLPKPDGTARAVYTGMIDPHMITEFVVGASLYFGEIIVQNPFLHPGSVRAQFSPIENPKQYRQEFLKSTFFLINLMPLVEDGTINLIPDPCYFDRHLQQQMFSMAEERSSRTEIDLDQDPRTKWAVKQDFQRSILALPPKAQRSQINRAMPGLSDIEIEETFEAIEQFREHDPFAVLQQDTFDDGKSGGLLNLMKMSPNFEISMFLAQATGSFIITDSKYRWHEILKAQHRELGVAVQNLTELTNRMARSEHYFLLDVATIAEMKREGRLDAYRAMMQDVCNYLSAKTHRASRAKWETQLTARFSAVHAASQKEIRKLNSPAFQGRMRCVIPTGGIRHNNVNRMLLTVNVDRHIDSVPMAIFMERLDTSIYERMA